MLKILLVEIDNINHPIEERLCCKGINILRAEYSPLFVSMVKEMRPDAILFNLDTPSDNLLKDLHTLNQELPLPVIMFADNGTKETIDKAIKAEVSAYVVDGLDGNRINSVIEVALSRFKQQQLLKNALEDARTQLEDRKQIDRAKAILMKTQHFTEDVAYHMLRKLAMDRNVTVGEMARNVIAMAKLLK